MLTNITRSNFSVSSGKASYVVRATIKAPLPAGSRLRDGTVGYTFSEEYQRSLEQASPEKWEKPAEGFNPITITISNKATKKDDTPFATNLKTPQEFEAYMKVNLAQQIEDFRNLDVKLARQIRTLDKDMDFNQHVTESIDFSSMKKYMNLMTRQIE